MLRIYCVFKDINDFYIPRNLWNHKNYHIKLSHNNVMASSLEIKNSIYLNIKFPKAINYATN